MSVTDPTEARREELNVLRDRVAHAIMFCEETLRALRGALERIDGSQAQS